MLMTRVQKIKMIMEVILNLKLLNKDSHGEVELFSEIGVSEMCRINSNLKNLTEEQVMLAVDGLAMICTYLYFGLGTPNSHLSNAPNAK